MHGDDDDDDDDDDEDYGDDDDDYEVDDDDNDDVNVDTWLLNALVAYKAYLWNDDNGDGEDATVAYDIQ